MYIFNLEPVPSQLKKFTFRDCYINCPLYVFAYSVNDEIVQQVEAAVKNIARRTYGQEMLDYFGGEIEVAHMKDKNPANYAMWNTRAYTKDGDIFLGDYTDLEGSIIHELAHIRYTLYEEGPSEKAERDFRSSPMADHVETSITKREREESRKREEEQREREAEMKRQSQEAMERMQSASNSYNSYNSDNSTDYNSYENTDSNDDSDNYSEEVNTNNSEQTWGGLWGAIFGAVSNKNTETRENREQLSSNNNEISSNYSSNDSSNDSYISPDNKTGYSDSDLKARDGYWENRDKDYKTITNWMKLDDKKKEKENRGKKIW